MNVRNTSLRSMEAHRIHFVERICTFTLNCIAARVCVFSLGGRQAFAFCRNLSRCIVSFSSLLCASRMHNYIFVYVRIAIFNISDSRTTYDAFRTPEKAENRTEPMNYLESNWIQRTLLMSGRDEIVLACKPEPQSFGLTNARHPEVGKIDGKWVNNLLQVSLKQPVMSTSFYNVLFL